MKYKLKFITILSFTAIGMIATSYSPVSNARSNPIPSQTDVTGAELFANNCARCHGADGTGGKGPDLTSEKRQAKWKDSDEKIVKKITKGGLFMPSFGKKLKAGEIKSIAAFVRTLNKKS